MVIGCIRDAVIKYDELKKDGKTPHIIFTKGHACVVTDEEGPEKIYCKGEYNPDITPDLIRKILRNPHSLSEIGEVKDDFYTKFKDEVLGSRPQKLYKKKKH